MDYIQLWFGSDLQSALFVIMNLIILESLLSVDNAAVLATMVMDLPKEQRPRALNYGIAGAYIYRVICLIFAAMLYKVVWLKALGGIYLLWLFVKHFKKTLKYKNLGYQAFQVISIGLFLYFDPYTGVAAYSIKGLLAIYGISLVWSIISSTGKLLDDDPENDNDNTNPIYILALKYLGPFWATVATIQLMDLAFSLDNIFAAVAFTDKIGLIVLGVMIGILALRFSAEAFVKLIEKFPVLELSAYLVLGLLGLKLIYSYACNLHHFGICDLKEGHGFDFAISLLTIAIFVVPVLISIYTKKKEQ